MDLRNEKNFKEDNFTGENNSDSRKENTPVKVLTANTIIGDDVVNGKGENLGSIKDIMLNLKNGEIEYIVHSFGGFMGMGDKYFAIPFENMKLDAKNERFILDYDKKVFEKAPGFDKNHWPETNNRHYNEVRTYWGNFMGPSTGKEPYQ